MNGTSGPASTASAYQIDPGRPVARLPGAAETDPDSDPDGLTDAFEKLAGTDPGKADTDTDGVFDGVEVQFGADPLIAASTIGPGAASGVGSGAAGVGGDPLGQQSGLDPSGGLQSRIGGDLGQGLGEAPGTGIGGADETDFDLVGASPQGDAAESLDFG